MTYKEQLESFDWKKKRMTILQRDSHKCQNCSNENLINELEDGLFLNFIFPPKRTAIDIDNFGENRYKKAGIDAKYSNLLTENSVVYSKKIPNWRQMVLGIRKLNSAEEKIFNFYENKINIVRDELNRNHYDYDAIKICVSKTQEILKKRREIFIELKKQNDFSKFEWKIMLGLHIHHKYYIKDLYAWQYKDDALITLCYTCHENLHKDNQVPVYDNDLNLLGHYHYCKRCHGAGEFPEYSHVQNGICFRCDGAKYEELIIDKVL